MPAENLTAQENSELIDVTQSAVIDAIDNVSEIIYKTQETADFEPHPHEIFYLTPEFWVGIAFMMVVVFLAKPVGKAAKNLLNKRREKIIDKINQAEKFRDEAQILLAQYERKFLHAQDEAAEILLKSQKEIELFQKEELAKLETELKHRRNEVEAGIDAAIEKAKKEINQAVSNKAVEIAKNYIELTNDSQKNSDNIDKSLNHIFKTLS